jgi:predicted ABC-type transport system involved in lysophospholipase L1 biosynthesis ATPase subunit
MTGTAPLIEIRDLEKASPGLPTIRVRHLVVGPGDRFTVHGLDAGAAEALVHLITGAALPDRGEIRLVGRRTHDVGSDMDWLASLDRFGIVTERAVLLDGLSIAANLALPITLDLDPIPDEVQARIQALASLVGLGGGADRPIERRAVNLTPLERMQMHLARALAVEPHALLLEHPTASLDPAAARLFGATLRHAADLRGLAWIAFANDEAFADAAGGQRGTIDFTTGAWRGSRTGFWKRVWPGISRAT